MAHTHYSQERAHRVAAFREHVLQRQQRHQLLNEQLDCFGAGNGGNQRRSADQASACFAYNDDEDDIDNEHVFQDNNNNNNNNDDNDDDVLAAVGADKDHRLFTNQHQAVSVISLDGQPRQHQTGFARNNDLLASQTDSPRSLDHYYGFGANYQRARHFQQRATPSAGSSGFESAAHGVGGQDQWPLRQSSVGPHREVTALAPDGSCRPNLATFDAPAVHRSAQGGHQQQLARPRRAVTIDHPQIGALNNNTGVAAWTQRGHGYSGQQVCTLSRPTAGSSSVPINQCGATGAEFTSNSSPAAALAAMSPLGGGGAMPLPLPPAGPVPTMNCTNQRDQAVAGVGLQQQQQQQSLAPVVASPAERPPALDVASQLDQDKDLLATSSIGSASNAGVAAESDPEADAIIRGAQETAQMALAMYQFTRGEGDLNTTQDLFTQAELFAEEANELYKEVRCFSYKVSRCTDFSTCNWPQSRCRPRKTIPMIPMR